MNVTPAHRARALHADVMYQAYSDGGLWSAKREPKAQMES